MRIDKPFQSFLAGFVFLIAIVCAGQATAQAWKQLAPTEPPTARYDHSAVFNPVTDRMIVFGGDSVGYSGYSYFKDVEVLTHADGKGGTPAWTQLYLPESPTPNRLSHSAVYDVANNRMIVFAGCVHGGACPANDTWVLSNADGTGGTPQWTQLHTATAPPARYGHSAVYDAASNRMIVFGGYNNSSHLNDTWVLSNANNLGGLPRWTQLTPPVPLPAARWGHTAGYNPASNRMIVFGGGIGGFTNDAWVLTNANGLVEPVWIQLNPTGTPPPAEYFHRSGYDPATNRLIVFGGTGPSGTTSGTWVLSNADGSTGTPAWTQLSPTGTLPLARYLHSAVYNPANNRMVVFGGYGGSYLNDTWVLTDANGVNLPVAIDIQPGSTANSFGLTRGTVVGVAILSSPTFDAPKMVDRASLTFGHVGTEASLITCSEKALDVNGDGLIDLICYFDVNKAGFQLGDTVGYLNGLTQLGDGIHGSDMVKINP